MDARATTVEVQKEILAERGMDLDLTPEKVDEVLLDIGYYRLGFYWHPFEINEEHDFKEGTKFSDALQLYYLDTDLRRLIIRYVNRIEISFRTKIVYYVSNHYPESPAWFVDSAVMKQEYINEFDSHYDDRFIDDNIAIRRHHSKYGDDEYAPAWKTLEFFTFGKVKKIFDFLQDKALMKEISNKLGYDSPRILSSHLRALVFVRNICAHGGVIFDLNLDKAVANHPQIAFNNGDKSSINAVSKVIVNLLRGVSLERSKEFENAYRQLLNDTSRNEVLKTLIIDEMKFSFNSQS